MYNTAIMKRLIVLVVFLTMVFVNPGAVLAQEETCVTVYGGGVVCGARTEIHEPVDTGLADINPIVLGAGLLSASGVLFYISRRRQRRVFEIK
jgi:LPXTG-motif cell wall-anchored protein